MTKRWQVLPKMEDGQEEKELPELKDITLQLLHNRHIANPDNINDFLNPNYDAHSLDPFLFADMAKAVDRILMAITKKQKVMVYGDYDADGVCATTILYSTLKELGLKVETYIPFRDVEGYGLNEEAVQGIVKNNFDLVITVDCGISNNKEIAILNQGGVDIIITDHHQEPIKRPMAYAVLNPSLDDSGYPFSKLCGAGVAYKLVQAIAIRQNEADWKKKLPAGFEKWLLDLVAIATIGDIVPLIGENRVFVKYGLMVIPKTKRIGLEKLIKSSQGGYKNIDTQFVGWRLAPRINAAGRINDASIAFNLLNSDDPQKIEELVIFLEKNNQKRQQITDKILEEALDNIGHIDDMMKILIAVGEDWPEGVVGLVAGRICDRYHRPALIISQKGDKFVGSGRSILEFNITDALKECGDVFERFGGHAQACGFSLVGEENLEIFKRGVTELAEQKVKDEDMNSALEIDMAVDLADVNWELWDELEKFEPFGEGNLKPLFVSYGLRVEQIQPVGKDSKHIRILAKQGDNPMLHKFIGFGFGEWIEKLKPGEMADIVYEVDVNEWNGNRELQLKIVDLKKSS